MRTKTGLPRFLAIKIPLSQSFPCVGDSGNETDLPHTHKISSKRISSLHFIMSIVKRPFYSFRWKRRLSGPCLDTTLPAAKYAYNLEHRETLFIIMEAVRTCYKLGS